MDSHRVGSGRVLKFGPACNSDARHTNRKHITTSTRQIRDGREAKTINCAASNVIIISIATAYVRYAVHVIFEK